MKKLYLLVLAVFLTGFCAFAQDNTFVPHKHYCQVFYNRFGFFHQNKSKVSFYFGEKYDRQGEDCYISDENGKRFQYGLDAVNYLSERGWTVEAFVVDPVFEDGDSLISDKIWLLSKDVTKEEDVLEGIIFTKVVK